MLSEALAAVLVSGILTHAALDARSGGYLDAGGSPALADYFAGPVTTCEAAGRNPAKEPDPSVVSPAGHLGVLQWLPSTWAAVASRTGYWDWRDPYQQGYNAAVWVTLTDPVSQWSCF